VCQRGDEGEVSGTALFGWYTPNPSFDSISDPYFLGSPASRRLGSQSFSISCWQDAGAPRRKLYLKSYKIVIPIAESLTSLFFHSMKVQKLEKFHPFF
jgi:hypothetical protein